MEQRHEVVIKEVEPIRAEVTFNEDGTNTIQIVNLPLPAGVQFKSVRLLVPDLNQQ